MEEEQQQQQIGLYMGYMNKLLQYAYLNSSTRVRHRTGWEDELLLMLLGFTTLFNISGH